MRSTVFLFDLDGVMVQPLGYRQAVRATVNHFARRMGLPNLAPDDETIAIFEAQGITCEWDMIPLTIAVLIEAVLAQADRSNGLDSLDQACERIRGWGVAELRVSYAPLFRSMGAFTVDGEAPADSLLRAVEGGEARHLFPRLAGKGVLRDLLSFTRRPALSQTTHLFENYVLGDRVFRETMGMEPSTQTPSLLEQYDRPLLNADTRARLFSAVTRPGMAVYTARPSIPLGPVRERLAVFAPEAELALRLVGLEQVALIGSGQMGELALKLGEHEDRLTKPAPFQALAAIAAACLGDRIAAINWLGRIYPALQKGEPVCGEDLSLFPAQVALHVFEDSPSGMRGAVEAGAMLSSRMGVHVSTTLWGVTDHPEKRQALSAAGARVYPNINLAIDDALG